MDTPQSKTWGIYSNVTEYIHYQLLRVCGWSFSNFPIHNTRINHDKELYNIKTDQETGRTSNLGLR